MMQLLLCSACKQSRPSSFFNKNKSRKTGYSNQCKNCFNLVNREYKLKNKEKIKRCADLYNKVHYSKNIEKIKQKSAKWKKDNKRKVTEYSLKYYSMNKEISKNRNKIWRENNKGSVSFYTSNRRALKRQASPKWLTKQHFLEIKWFYDMAKELQWLSEEKLTVDHIIPLKGKNVCGLHVPWNLQILPLSQNSRKRNKILASSSNYL
jgi:hypothetical protein